MPSKIKQPEYKLLKQKERQMKKQMKKETKAVTVAATGAGIGGAGAIGAVDLPSFPRTV